MKHTIIPIYLSLISLCKRCFKIIYEEVPQYKREKTDIQEIIMRFRKKFND